MTSKSEMRRLAEQGGGMSKLQNEKLLAAMKEERRRWLVFAREQIKKTLAGIALLDRAAGALDAAGIEWWASGDKIYVRVEGKTKTEFSAAVKTIAGALNEAPDIRVEPKEYMADFEHNHVHVYLAGAEDCKLIDVTETKTVTVKKPHPSCIAALSVLEQA